MKKFSVSWSAYGEVEVEAEDEDEAESKFHDLRPEERGEEDCSVNQVEESGSEE